MYMTVLEIKDLDVSYGESKIITGLNLSVSEGETVTIMGRNGMGKTTLMKALIGRLPVDKGSIFVMGQDLSKSES